jgi:broad specificity phosphatase PhoE
LSSTHFTAIYASNLLRAHSTAKAIQEAQLSSLKPPLTTSPLLREQHFGIAEGKQWSIKRISGLTDQEHFDQQFYPVLTDRDGKFPEGESLNDLARRANQALDELVFPHVYKALKDRKTSTDDDVVNIALVSHGLCISEMVAALVRRDSEVQQNKTVIIGVTYSGLLNTAWTRASIDVPVDFLYPVCT